MPGPAIVVADVDRLPHLRRSQPHVAMVAVVSRRGFVADALDRGADAVVVGSTRPAELRARVRSLLRSPPAALRAGPIEVDRRSHIARLDGAPLTLTRRELALLALLASQPGRTFTKDELRRGCWGGIALPTTSRTLERHVSRLRARLGPHAPMLVTVWGVGYRLDEPA